MIHWLYFVHFWSKIVASQLPSTSAFPYHTNNERGNFWSHYWVCLFYDPFILAVASVVKKAGMGHKKADNPSLIFQQIKACRKKRSSFRYFVPMSSTHDGIELMPTWIFGNVVHVRPSNWGSCNFSVSGCLDFIWPKPDEFCGKKTELPTLKTRRKYFKLLQVFKWV